MKFNVKTQVFALISLLISTQLSGGIARASVTSFEQGYLLVGTELIMVEFAQDKDEQTTGLSNRALHANNSFMLFIYDQPQQVSFWMKDTRKDLSIAFINVNNQIIQTENLKARSLKIVKSKSSQVKYVFEAPKGFFSVNNIKIGDEVFARPNQTDAGSVAEFARIQEDELAIKPSNMTHEQAASVPLAGLTAWQALVTKGNIKEGDKVLVHAGSGGVGTVAIQIAKHFGAFVATTTSGKNADLVKELGADLVIDYTTQKFEDELSDYDLVIDTIGGETLARSFEVLKKGGTMVSVKSQDNDNLAEKYGVHFEWFFMSPDGKMLAELAKLISDGTVKTVIDSTFAMDQAADAFEKLATGRAVGKIVVTVK